MARKSPLKPFRKLLKLLERWVEGPGSLKRLESFVVANQFTKGTRTQHDESTKDQIRAELLSKRYYKFAMSKGEKAKKMGIGPAQVAAAKMLIDKGKPSLQSVEQSQADPLQDLSEEGIVEMAKALILQHPEVIRALNLIPDPAAVPQSGDMSGDKKLTASE